MFANSSACALPCFDARVSFPNLVRVNRGGLFPDETETFRTHSHSRAFNYFAGLRQQREQRECNRERECQPECEPGGESNADAGGSEYQLEPGADARRV